MQFDIKNEKHREKLLCEIAYYMMMTGYKKAGKFLYIPSDYVTEGGFELGEIWAGLQDLYNQNKLSEDDIKFLIRLRMQFPDSPKKDLKKWIDRAEETEDYYKEHGTLSMPNNTKFQNGTSMFQWVHHQKALYKRGELSPYQKRRLEEMGIEWIKPKKATDWDKAYQYATEFYNENGHLFVNMNYVTSDGFELGKWICKQRDMYLGLSQSTITDEQIEMLEDIGMFWEDIKNAEWDWFVGLLRECIKKTKRPFTINRNYRYKNFPLGEQIGDVIQRYGEGKLTQAQERDLRSIGFKFNRIIK